MNRLPDWHVLLEQQFLAGRAREFAWGGFDCALFACDCICAETAIDPAAKFRGKYQSEAEASVWGSLSEIAQRITAQFDMPEITPGHAGRGDLIFLDNGTPSGSLGIVDFSGAAAVCPGSRGLIRVRRHRWKRAWRV